MAARYSPITPPPWPQGKTIKLEIPDGADGYPRTVNVFVSEVAEVKREVEDPVVVKQEVEEPLVELHLPEQPQADCSQLAKPFKCFNCGSMVVKTGAGVRSIKAGSTSARTKTDALAHFRSMDLPRIPARPGVIEYELSPSLVASIKSENRARHFIQSWALHVFKVVAKKFHMGSYAEKKMLMRTFGPWWARFWPEYMPVMPMTPPAHKEKPYFVSKFMLETVGNSLPKCLTYRANAAGFNCTNVESDMTIRKIKARDYLHEMLVSDAAEGWEDPVRYFVAYYWAAFYPHHVRMVAEPEPNDTDAFVTAPDDDEFSAFDENSEFF